MMRVLLACGLALLLAGCAASAPIADPSSTLAKQLDEGANKLDVPVLPSTPPAAGERTLDKAPQWRLGEYWEYHLVDGFTGHEYDVTRVVAGTDGPNYLVGFPLEAFSNDILVFHIPGYGDVKQSDLSFEVHDVVFAPLQFPLVAGTSWKTAFEGRPGEARVLSTSGTTAVVHAADSVPGTLGGQTTTFNITATYDAQTGEITKLDYPGYASYEITKHGYGYNGLVRVPHAHDLVFQNGRVAGTQDLLNPTGPPHTSNTETVDIPAGYDHLAFTLIVGNIVGAPTAGGYYDEKVASPNGTVFELTMLPNEMPSGGLKLAFFGTGDPTGTWTLTHTAAGPGLVEAEGIGYHSIDVTLPSGCVVQSSHSGHHAAPCKVSAQQAGDTKQL